MTTSIFYATAAISVLTVAAPQIIGCPAHKTRVGADSKESHELKKVVVKDA